MIAISNLDEEIGVKIVNIKGDEPRYDAWSVVADAWIIEDSGRSYERTIQLNVLKDSGNFEKTSDGHPKIVDRVKERYANMIEQDKEYKKKFIESLEKEKDVVSDIKGKEYKP